MRDGLELDEDEDILVGTKEIAAMWSLNREFVTDVLTKKPDFPKPALDFSRKTRRYLRSEVIEWRKAHAKKAN